MRSTIRLALFVLPLLLLSANAQQAGDPIERIREAELKADLFELAGDHTRGREGGTIDELAASAWIAERARAAGLEPAGDNGTYFQFFPLERFRVSAGSLVTLAGSTLRMGTDVVTDATVVAQVDASTTVLPQDTVTDTAQLAAIDLKGRAVIVRYVPPPPAADAPAPPAAGPRATNTLRTWARGLQKSLAAQAPAAIVVLVPDEAKDQWERVAFPFSRGTYALDPDGTAEPRTPPRGTPLLYVRESAAGGPLPADVRPSPPIFPDSFTSPS